jgi:uncharacterized damage-inducible protein DinB
MKRALLIVLAVLLSPLLVQGQQPPTLKSVLLEQLRSTHNQKGWFVPANTAVEGVTAEQANWVDGKGNHSLGQLASHLVYWNRRNLAKFKGEPLGKGTSNDETFTRFDSKQWATVVKDLDSVMTDWEKAVESADAEKLKSWYSTIANISTHNAYHVGQMIYVRKEQGSWDPEKGVKE